MPQRIGIRHIVVLVVGLLLFWQAVLLRRGLLEEGRPHADPCVSNLRTIGDGCILYALDHEGRFPDDLAPLARIGFSRNPELLVCASLARNVWDMSWSDLKQAELSDEYRSYCYVSGLRNDDPDDYVLVFDEEWNHKSGAVNAFLVSRSWDYFDGAPRLHDRLSKQERELAAKGREMRVIRPSWSRYPEPPEYPPSPKSESLYERLGGTKGMVPLLVGGLILVAAVGYCLMPLFRRRL